MIMIIAGVPAYREPSWPHPTEAWLFCESPGDLEELRELGKALGYQEWRGGHCPPHWRITEEEAGLLPHPRVDSLTMTLHHRAWRRYLNDMTELPKPKSHKRSGPPAVAGLLRQPRKRTGGRPTGTASRGRRKA